MGTRLTPLGSAVNEFFDLSFGLPEEGSEVLLDTEASLGSALNEFFDLSCGRPEGSEVLLETEILRSIGARAGKGGSGLFRTLGGSDVFIFGGSKLMGARDGMGVEGMGVGGIGVEPMGIEMGVEPMEEEPSDVSQGVAP